jgi:hypothetical protein
MRMYSHRLLPLTLSPTRVQLSPRMRGEGWGRGQAAFGTKQG